MEDFAVPGMSEYYLHFPEMNSDPPETKTKVDSIIQTKRGDVRAF